MRATHEGSLAHRGRRTRRSQREQPIPYISPEALHAALANGAQYISSEALAELAHASQAGHRASRAPISPEHLLAAQQFIEQQVLLPAWQNATDLESTCLSVSAGGPEEGFNEQFTISVQRGASGSRRWNDNPCLRCNRNACGACNPISPSDKLFKSMWKYGGHVFQLKSHHRGDDNTRISSFTVIAEERPGSWRAIRSSEAQVRWSRNTNSETGEPLTPEEGVIYH
jgi:hypothetical protein